MHKHHIMPRSAGGTNHPENLVEVSVEEHAEIHRCLWVYGGRWQDEIAWRSLAGIIGKEEIILEMSKRKPSEETKRKMRKPHPTQNCSHNKNQSAETRRKNSEWHKGKSVVRGRKWYTNGVDDKMCFTLPKGFYPGRVKNRKEARR